ncbi:MAG: hypothetical protein FJY83_02980 [Candidatus Aminicenantes bacterium]|nr:hypothetical protein [Candidatus Aminicenantes bacterium]
MEFLSYAALILLSAAGYAAGAALRAGRTKRAEPEVLDLFAQAAVWAGAVASRTAMGWNRWLAIPAWTAAGIVLGALLSRPRQTERKHGPADTPEAARTDRRPLARAWTGWKRFSKRMGNFQSRMLLSWIYFLLVTPFGLAVRLFSDPLRIKKRRAASHWIERPEVKPDLESAGKQF